MKDQIMEKIIWVQILAFVITTLALIVTNMGNPRIWWMILFTAGMLFLFYIRNYYFYPMGRMKRAIFVTIILDLILIFILISMDFGDSSVVFLLILISDITLHSSMGLGLLLSVGAYLSVVWHVWQSNLSETSLWVFEQVLPLGIWFLVVYVFLYVIHYILKQKAINDGILNQLSMKTIEQENTLLELREAYARLEEMTILKERNKLAREIHDTLGHTLTTVLVEIEAGKILLNKEELPPALEKIDLAQEQLRRGMQALRKSVGLLSRGDELIDFKASILEMVHETEKHTGVDIHVDLQLNHEVGAHVRKVLMKALQEGLTNGLKHGGATVFVLRISEAEDEIEFILQDNGCGCPAFQQGFGLKSMEDRVREALGTLKVESEPEEGFCIQIRIPIHERGEARE